MNIKYTTILLFLLVFLSANSSFGQEILIHKDNGDLVKFNPKTCTEVALLLNISPFGFIGLDYTKDNSTFVVNSQNIVSEYYATGVLKKKAPCVLNTDFLSDMSINNQNRAFFIENFGMQYSISEKSYINCLSTLKYKFPDSVDVVSSCEYNGKLLIIAFGNSIYEIDPDDNNSLKYLLTLPDQFIGYDFNIINYQNCDADEVILLPQFFPEVYKLDMNTKIMSKICDNDYSINRAATSPHPYISCLNLDKNNSTTSLPKDYATQLCQSGTVNICDIDVKVKALPSLPDSMHVWLSKGLQDAGNEQLTLLGALPTGVTMKKNGNDFWFYFPKNFTEANIENLIKQLRYTNSKPAPSIGEREITFYLYANGMVSDPAVAHVVISKTQNTQQNISSCSGKTLIVNGINIKKDTTFCLNLKGKEGCDSTHCYKITFSAQQKGTENQEICFGNTYVFDGKTYTTDNIFTKKLTSSQGCDSLVIYNFKVLPQKENTQQMTICNGQSFDFYGTKISQSGSYEKILKTKNGCDSLEKLTLTVLPKKENTKSATICSGSTFDFYGKKLTQSGDYQEVLKTKNGCDSLEKLTLTVLPKKENTKSATICSGSTFDFYGKKLTQSGDYQEVLKTKNGCDSLEKLTLTVLSKKENTKSATICSGAIYDFYGKKLTQSGDYQEVLKTKNGCDSLEKLTLTVLPKKENTKSATICSGSTFDFYGKKLTQSGDYQEVLKTKNGCDSLEKLTLTVLPKKENTKSATICSGAIYDFYGKKLTQSGDYQEVLKTKNGCDSLEKLILTIVEKPKLTLPKDLSIAEGQSVTLKAIVKADSLKSIFWSPDVFLNKNNSLEVVSTPTQNVVYQVVIKDKNDCTTSDTIRVFLLAGKKVFAPSSFSPNDDGINDNFEIFIKPDEGKILEYEIFDKWGGLLHQSNEPWNGKDCQSGVYLFKVNILWKDGKEKMISGEVMLVR